MNEQSPLDESKYQNESMKGHLSNIHFMRALYGHCKAYVECQPMDNGAINLPNGNIWIKELDLTEGAKWQVRRRIFEIQDFLMANGVKEDIVIAFRKEFITGKR